MEPLQAPQTKRLYAGPVPEDHAGTGRRPRMVMDREQINEGMRRSASAMTRLEAML
jgi:hypothetical protein